MSKKQKDYRRRSQRSLAARVEALKDRARHLAGGEFFEHTASDCPLEIQERFWEDIVAWESAPTTTYLDRLTVEGVIVPPALELADQELSDKLWELIRELERRGVYLTHTDHLSDRELYGTLREELLREPTKDVAEQSGWNCQLDVLGGFSHEERLIYHEFYADELERASWAAEFPEDVLPPRRKPPFDRDRKLPKMSCS